MMICPWAQLSAELRLEDQSAAAATTNGDGDCHVFQTDHELFFHLVK
jgi:hypothetical protein